MKERDKQASEDLLIGLIQDDWPKKAVARAIRILESEDFVEIIDFHLKICRLTEEIINLLLYGEGLDAQIKIPSFWNRLAETMLDYAAFQKLCGPLKKETDFFIFYEEDFVEMTRSNLELFVHTLPAPGAMDTQEILEDLRADQEFTDQLLEIMDDNSRIMEMLYRARSDKKAKDREKETVK